MKQLTLIILAQFFLFQLSAQSNDIKVDEQGFTFGDGSVVNQQTANSELPINAAFFYADFSNSIVGDVTLVQYEDFVEMYEVNHYLYKNLHSSGAPIGNIKNKFFSFKKKMDIATVPILDLYKVNSPISSVKIYIVGFNNSGQTINLFSIELTNVRTVEYWIDFDYRTSNGKEIIEQYVVSYDQLIIKNEDSNASVIIPFNH